MKSTLHLLGVPKRFSWAFKYNEHKRFFETLLKRKNKQNQNRDATKVPFLMCTVLKIKENKRRKNKSTKKG